MNVILFLQTYILPKTIIRHYSTYIIYNGIKQYMHVRIKVHAIICKIFNFNYPVSTYNNSTHMPIAMNTQDSISCAHYSDYTRVR